MNRLMKTGLLLMALSLVFGLSGSAWAKTIYSHDFETLPVGVSEKDALQKTPYGWVGSGGGELWSLKLSDELAYSGKYAMRIVVDPNNEPWGVHISSQPIPVTPGKEYTVSIMLWNVASEVYTGRSDLYVEFWPEGAWWGDTDPWSLENWQLQNKGAWENKTRLHSAAKSSPMGKWAPVSATAVAPPDAKYMTIGFWTSKRVVTSYVDDVVVDEYY